MLFNVLWTLGCLIAGFVLCWIFKDLIKNKVKILLNKIGF
jgi:hypothetical protein